MFQSPKSPFLIAQLLQTASSEDDVVLDFFAGSGTTGHAVMLQNARDGARRRFILVQLPEPIDVENKDQKAAAEFCDSNGLAPTLSALTKERLRRAGAATKAEYDGASGDLGFRVFKLAPSNIRAWNPNPDDLAGTLMEHTEHLVPGRSEQDVLYEVLLKLGLDLAVPIETKTIAGQTVHSVGAGALMVCLSGAVTREVAEPLALGIAE